MDSHFKRYVIVATLALAIGVTASQAGAETDNDEADKLATALERQGNKLAAEEKALQAQERKLMAEQAEFNQLKAKIENLTGKRIRTAQASADDSAASRAQQAKIANTNATANGSGATGSQASVPDEVGTDRKPVAPEKPPEVAKYIEEGGVLLPKGKLLITPGLEYDHSNATNIAIQGFSIIPALNIGDFEVAKVDQDILIGTVDARLGVTNRFEIEAKVPYLYGNQDTLGRPIGAGSSTDSLASINGNGIGDVEFGAHYQVNKGLNNWPFFIANMRFKTITGTGPFEISTDQFGQEKSLPTGSGFYALQPSMTIIYPSDPVVFYSNLGYTHNFERSFATYGTIAPGDSVNASFGMSTSLNDATSFSLGYSHSMVFDTTQNGHILPGSQYLQVGSVDLGWAYAFNDRVSIDVNASIGVTDAAPSDRIIFRVPIAFDAF